MEIEVGEYVRTKNGLIFKVTEYWLNECKTEHIEKNIKSHSKNIIDLIEVGDFVEIIIGTYGNGKEATQKFEMLSQDMIEEAKKDKMILEDNIKSILTHEMYERSCYKIGD